MKEKIYVYCDVVLKDFIKNIFVDFEIYNLSQELLNDASFKNKNTLLITKKNTIHSINKSFFQRNNSIVFFLKAEKDIEENITDKTKKFSPPIKIKKFLDEAKIFFLTKTFLYKDIKITNDTLINANLGISCPITLLEKKIFIEFVEHKKIKKDFFLEKILDLKKDLETKTLESHLTRIRKKLATVRSNIKISSKDDVFYIYD